MNEKKKLKNGFKKNLIILGFESSSKPKQKWKSLKFFYRQSKIKMNKNQKEGTFDNDRIFFEYFWKVQKIRIFWKNSRKKIFFVIYNVYRRKIIIPKYFFQFIKSWIRKNYFKFQKIHRKVFFSIFKNSVIISLKNPVPWDIANFIH